MSWTFGTGTPLPPRESVEEVRERELAEARAERDALLAALREVERMVDHAKVRPTDASRWLNRIEETARVALASKEGA